MKKIILLSGYLLFGAIFCLIIWCAYKDYATTRDHENNLKFYENRMDKEDFLPPANTP